MTIGEEPRDQGSVAVDRLRAAHDSALVVAAATAALGDYAAPRHIVAVTDLVPEQLDATLAALVETGLATLEGTVRLSGEVSPVAVLALLPAMERSLLHRRAAEVLHDLDAPDLEVASRLAETHAVGAPWVIATLGRAARQARRAGDRPRAVQLLRRALAERPAQEERLDLLLELARTEVGVSADDAVCHYRDAIALIDDPGRRMETRLLLASALGAASRVMEGLEQLDLAIAEAATPEARLRAELAYVAVARQTVDTRPLGRERVWRLADAARAMSDDAVTRTALLELGYEQVLAGVPHDVVIETVMKGLGGPALDGLHELPPLSRFVAMLTLIWCGELRTAERAALLVLTRARRRGSATEAASAHQVLMNVYWHRGGVADALEAADQAFAGVDAGFQAMLPGNRGFAAMALATLGRADDATLALELPGGEAAWSAVASYHGYLYGKAEAELLLGQHQQAHVSARRLGVLAHAMGTTNPAVLPWRSIAAEAAVALGEPDEARTLSGEEVALLREFGAPAPLARALRVHALTLSPGDAMRSLDEAVALAAACPDRLERAKVHLARGRAMQSVARNADARADVEVALADARDAGAVVLIEQATSLVAGLQHPQATPGSETATADRSSAIRATIRALGAFAVLDADGRDVTPPGVPGRAIRVLVAAAEPIHVEVLADRLWNEPLPPEQVKARLRNVLSRARVDAGPLIVRRGDMIGLHEHVAVDASEFDMAAHAALTGPDLGCAVEASRLYRGDLLPSDPFADWAALRREHLRMRYLAVTDMAARLAADAGLADVAIDLLDEAIRRDPFDDQRYEAAAKVLEGAGRAGAARAMWDRASAVRASLGL